MRKLMMVALTLLVSSAALAQTQYKSTAKFVCGRADTAHVDAYAFSPGIYYTTINVSNQTASTISGTKRMSVALLGQKAGTVSPTVSWSLAPGQSMQVDCADIWKRLGLAPGTFIDGFAYLTGTGTRFDVTAVYTVGDGSRPISMDVDAIEVR